MNPEPELLTPYDQTKKIRTPDRIPAMIEEQARIDEIRARLWAQILRNRAREGCYDGNMYAID